MTERYLMKRIFSALSVAAALVAFPAFAEAQATLGPQIAYHNDFDFGIGAALTVSADAIDPRVDFMADFVWFFPDPAGLNYFELNGNLLFDFVVEGSTVTPFALGGLNIASWSYDSGFGPGNGGGDNTELGLNLGGGIKFDLGTFRPMLGVRLEIEGGDGFVIFGTVPFALQGS